MPNYNRLFKTESIVTVVLKKNCQKIEPECDIDEQIILRKCLHMRQ